MLRKVYEGRLRKLQWRSNAMDDRQVYQFAMDLDSRSENGVAEKLSYINILFVLRGKWF